MRPARLADLARKRGLEVEGVMGYEGHIVGLADRDERIAGVEASMSLLTEAHSQVGGDTSLAAAPAPTT